MQPSSVVQEPQNGGERLVWNPEEDRSAAIWLRRLTQGRRRLMIKGPSQSGKTSLLLEAAVELATSSTSACACQNCVSATPVLLLKRIRNAHNQTEEGDEEDVFPLYAPSKDNSQSKDWDPRVLERIRVHHYASDADLLYALWTLQTMSPNDRPCRGILLDDLTEQSASTEQIIAVFADSAAFLNVPAVVAIQTDDKRNNNNNNNNNQRMSHQFVDDPGDCIHIM